MSLFKKKEKKYNINVMPTLIFTDQSGIVLKKLVGYQSYDTVVDVFMSFGWVE